MRATIKTPHGTIRDPEQAFAQAINDGRLSTSPHDTRYAGHFMYMHHDHAGVAHFKHSTTRRYLPADEVIKR